MNEGIKLFCNRLRNPKMLRKNFGDYFNKIGLINGKYFN